MLEVLASVLDNTSQPTAPLGDSVEAALVVLRDGLQALAHAIVQDAPTLQARERLIQHGAERQTATLAAGIAAACYNTAYTATADDPAKLPDAIDATLKQVTELDLASLAAKLKS